MFKKKEEPKKSHGTLGLVMSAIGMVAGLAALTYEVLVTLKRLNNIGLDEEDFDNMFDDEDINI